MATFRVAAGRVLRYPVWDALFVGLSLVHGAVLALAPAAPVIAILLWWNANTISHNFIHRPFFSARAGNQIYSAYLTLVLGFPQTLWRRRHLKHHAETATRGDGPSKSEGPYVRSGEGPYARSGEGPYARSGEGPYAGSVVGPFGFRRAFAVELLLLSAAWTLVATQAPSWFLTAYLPGWAIGLGLCQLQGYFEHARGTRSHYGRIYNFLFFNDGLHVEHHRRPGAHWTELDRLVRPETPRSRWPPVLRWLDALSLEGLERLVLRSAWLRLVVLTSHERAFRRLLPLAGDVTRVTVVGGGLFPRTALVLRRLLPHAELTVVDARADHIDIARPILDDGVRFVHATFDPTRPCDADLVVIPLSFSGSRRRVYDHPPAPAVLVHDWITAARPPSVVVSWMLLKRLNLVRATDFQGRVR